MKRQEKLQQILRIKALRRRKAEIAMVSAFKTAKSLELRAASLRERQAAKTAVAQSYPQRRFMKLQASDDARQFFSSMAIGLFRHRRDAASLGLRSQRAEEEYTNAKIQRQTSVQTYLKTLASHDAIAANLEKAQAGSDRQLEESLDASAQELLQIMKHSYV